MHLLSPLFPTKQSAFMQGHPGPCQTHACRVLVAVPGATHSIKVHPLCIIFDMPQASGQGCHVCCSAP